MSEKKTKAKAKISLIKKPIVKNVSPFVGGQQKGPKKIIAHNDATIRR